MCRNPTEKENCRRKMRRVFFNPDCFIRSGICDYKGAFAPESHGVIFAYDFSNPRPPFPWRCFFLCTKRGGIMKRNHKVCMFLLAVTFGVGRLDVAVSAPTSATCKDAFASTEPQCSEYSVGTATLSTGNDLYVCTCTKCNTGYYITRNHNEYKYYGPDYLYLPNGCAAGGSGGGGTVTKTCTTGSLCTMCKGPSVTINGQIYCGMWSDGTRTCTAGPAASAAYLMSECCDSAGYAVGGSQVCRIMGCKPGFALNDDKTACVCNVGYYGNTTACTQCPSSGGINGLTAGIGKTQITDCFFPAGLKLPGTNGTFEYNQDCYYTK